MSGDDSAVFIVDDDPSMCEALVRLLGTAVRRAQVFRDDAGSQSHRDRESPILASRLELLTDATQVQDVAPKADRVTRRARRIRCVTLQSLPSPSTMTLFEKHLEGSWERWHVGFGALHLGRSFSSLVKRRFVSCRLLDLAMPGMSGLEVKQQLEARGLRISTVSGTAHADDELDQHLVPAGAIAILPKPVDQQMLRRLVQRVLDE